MSTEDLKIIEQVAGIQARSDRRISVKNHVVARHPQGRHVLSLYLYAGSY